MRRKHSTNVTEAQLGNFIVKRGNAPHHWFSHHWFSHRWVPRRWVLAIGFTGTMIAACATNQETTDILAGAHYPAGYADGCATAREAEKSFSVKTVQDEDLFEHDAGYRSGWRQGYLSCKEHNSDVDDTTDMGIRKDIH